MPIGNYTMVVESSVGLPTTYLITIAKAKYSDLKEYMRKQPVG